MPTAIRHFVRSLGLDAYVVGGAVRDELLGLPHTDEDFLVPGVDQARLCELLTPHGRVEDLEVHGQLVGVRLHPHDPVVRALAPAGIELTPPRTERSTGPGHRDFEIVGDPDVTVAEDMLRRDFTINAIARRLSTGEIVDPSGGVGDLARRELRTVSPHSFREDPLRLLRGLRLVSQLGVTLAGETAAQMRLEAAGLRHVSPERIGGGLAADGLGELSKLLLGARPAAALRLARETGVLQELLPELNPSLGYRLAGARQPQPLDEHLFAVEQATADGDASLAVRLAALLHDAGKPLADATGEGHAALSAGIAARVLTRLRYPVRVQRHVESIVRHHAFRLDGELDDRFARRFLAAHGEVLAFELVTLKEADLAVKVVAPSELAAVATLRRLLERERGSAHRLADLAVSGSDLLALGFAEGPELGRVLHDLLAVVVDDPARNERAWLLEHARRELP